MDEQQLIELYPESYGNEISPEEKAITIKEDIL